ncbi:hypothetical protein RJT34_13712 [Clitoria ternatea]|uniref:DUF3741 domain-containing protein n=1 Tax=Clitoria ternatea TaxID=43366 RepID=A0AAN9JR59_CLITE
MKEEIRTCCYNDGSTSTFNKQNDTIGIRRNHSQGHFPRKVMSPTLEDLILQLDQLETKFSDDYNGKRGRLSCVNNSNILRSSRREALDQYPRFSLDGRGAMYRSSLEKVEGRRSICCDTRVGRGLLEDIDLVSRFCKGVSSPHTFAGESVVWCKPGVVARLMGLEAIPLPVNNKKKMTPKKSSLLVCRMQNPRRSFERHGLEA